MCTFFLCISGANIYANTGYKQEKGTNKFSDSVAIYSQKKKSYVFVNDKT